MGVRDVRRSDKIRVVLFVIAGIIVFAVVVGIYLQNYYGNSPPPDKMTGQIAVLREIVGIAHLVRGLDSP